MLAEPQIVFCVTSAPDQATHEGRTVRISRTPSQALLCQSKRPICAMIAIQNKVLAVR